MPTTVPRSTVWKSRAFFFGGLLLGLGLLAWAARSSDPPVGLWVTGGLLTAFFGYCVGSAIVFRLRYRTREERDAARERLLMGDDGHARVEARGLLATEATKRNADVLRIGRDASAVVTFAADGNRGDDEKRLVYLELDVSAHGARPHRARAGDYVTPDVKAALVPGVTLAVKVDPVDPERVAVDWARTPSLLRPATSPATQAPAPASGATTIFV